LYEYKEDVKVKWGKGEGEEIKGESRRRRFCVHLPELEKERKDRYVGEDVEIATKVFVQQNKTHNLLISRVYIITCTQLDLK